MVLKEILIVVSVIGVVIGSFALGSYIEFGGFGTKAQKVYIDTRNKTVLKIPALVK